MFATPTVAGDLLFVGSCNGLFRALERKTGKIRWSYDTQQDGHAVEFHGDPLPVEDLVITASDFRVPGGIAHLYAFDQATGKPRWKYQVAVGVGADVQRIGPNVYAMTFGDELICLDWKTGELVWRFATGRPNEEFLMNSAPAAAGNRVFVGGLDGVVYALDAGSGQVLWKRELGGRISTSMLLAGGSLYAGSSNRHLYRLEPTTGAVTADFAAEEQPAGNLLFADDSLLLFLADPLSGMTRKLACLDASLKAIRWSETASGPWSSSRPYAWNHEVLAGNERGELFGFRIADGSRRWSEKFEGVLRGIGSSEGMLYVGTLKGRVSAWKRKP